MEIPLLGVWGGILHRGYPGLGLNPRWGILGETLTFSAVRPFVVEPFSGVYPQELGETFSGVRNVWGGKTTFSNGGPGFSTRLSLFSAPHFGGGKIGFSRGPLYALGGTR